MAGNTAPADAGIEAALTRAREDGMATARAEAQTKITEAYASGRTDAAAIMAHAEAAGRATLAAELAGDASFTVDRAASFLAKTPKADDNGNAFKQRLHANNPGIESGPAPAPQQPQQTNFMGGVLDHLNAMNAPRR